MFDGGTTHEAMPSGGDDSLPESLRGAPGPELAALLGALQFPDLDAESLLEAASAFERLISWATAGQAAALAAFTRRRARGHALEDERAIAHVDEFAIDELAVQLCVSKTAAWSRVAFASELERLPLTAAALAAGEIDPRRARVITDGTTPLLDEVAEAVERQVVGRASEQTTGQLRASMARAVIAADPAGADARHEVARRGRRLSIRPADDGMSSLWALLPAEQGVRLRNAIEWAARADTLPDDDRSMDARRVDALIGLCCGDGLAGAVADGVARGVGAGGRGRGGREGGGRGGDRSRSRSSAPDVRVTIDAATLLRLQESPAMLAGYGPIPPQLARLIAADGAWRRLITDPDNGAAMDLGRRRYRPTAALSEFVKARDVTCRFPCCRRGAEGCDEDHVVPFPIGPTSARNLVPLCRHHHRVKTHAPGWSERRDDAGRVHWTTPTGKVITVQPEAVGPADPYLGRDPRGEYDAGGGDLDPPDPPYIPPVADDLPPPF